MEDIQLMDQIKRAGRQLKWIVVAVLILTPLVYVGLFLSQGPLALLQLPETIRVDLTYATIVDTIVMFLLPALTPLVYWCAFYLLYDLASQYAEGAVFTSNAVIRLRHIGILLLLTDFVYLLQKAITGPLLTWLGLTEGFVSVELKLGMSIVGLFIVLISRVMVIASELDEHLRLTV